MIRRFLEPMSRGVRFHRRLPPSLGGDRIIVTPEAGLCYWYRTPAELDQEMQRALLEFVRAGDSFWDVGANLGWISVAAAALAGPKGAVLAIEPDAVMVTLLRRSVSERPPGRASIDVLPIAIADKVGVARFMIDRRGRAWNAIQGYGRMSAGGCREIQVVPTTTIDALAEHFRVPDVIKIDVEGAELPVLQGARGVLSRFRPILFCEVDAAHSREVFEFLRGFGYLIFDMQAEPANRHEMSFAPWNTLALHQDSHHVARAGVPRQVPS